MRCLWYLVLVSLATGICTAQIPSLVGNWTGSSIGYFADDGSYKLKEGNISLAIVEQNDRLFKGNVTYTLNGKKIAEGIAGAIGLDNKTISIAEFNAGYDQGKIVSNDEIELVYIEDGPKGKVTIDTFHKIANHS